jgi:hypothetical protein
LSAVFSQAIDGFRQQARKSCLACPARTCKQVGMPDTFRDNRVSQGLDNMILPDNFGPALGAVFAI